MSKFHACFHQFGRKLFIHNEREKEWARSIRLWNMRPLYANKYDAMNLDEVNAIVK